MNYNISCWYQGSGSSRQGEWKHCMLSCWNCNSYWTMGLRFILPSSICARLLHFRSLCQLSRMLLLAVWVRSAPFISVMWTILLQLVNHRYGLYHVLTVLLYYPANDFSLLGTFSSIQGRMLGLAKITPSSLWLMDWSNLRSLGPTGNRWTWSSKNLSVIASGTVH